MSHFGKKGSSNFLIPVYIVHLIRPLSLFQGNSLRFRIKLSCTHLKSESHPKTLNLWSITPYKNTIKCLWMPFFYIFAINMEKVYPTVQVRETNIILMSDGRGGIFFFLYKLQKFIKWKSFFLHTSITTNTVNRTELEWNGRYRNASWVYKNEHMETLATTSLLFPRLDASLCPQHDFVASS